MSLWPNGLKVFGFDPIDAGSIPVGDSLMVGMV